MPGVYLEALRPRQWTKNLVLFAPLVFAKRAFDPDSMARAAAAFLVFCALSGAVYLLNDLRDLEQDRRHPTKRNRPLAAGRLSPRHAVMMAVVVLLLALGGAWLLDPGLLTSVDVVGRESAPLLSADGRAPSFLSTCLAYLLMQLAYSLWLKHVVILDVLLVALGFVLRAMAGAVVIRVDISHWLLVCTIFLALFLSLAKRRHEVVLLEENASDHRRSLAEYDLTGLDLMISMVGAVTLVAYALYTTSEDTRIKFGTVRLSLTLPFVIYGIFRYIYLVRRHDEGGDPSMSLLSDRPLLLAVALWGLAVVAILYS
jgi:4-hydroxybenzoate polyprenyltransferase